LVVASDAEARRVVEDARRAARAVPPLGLVGGDLQRTLGGRRDADGLRRADALRVPVDLGSALIDGRQFWFVAHLLARRSWLSGRIVAAMNAQFAGAWNVAPRSHPNDGLLDVLDVDAALSLRDRLRARRRLPTGEHVPHPQIRQRRVPAIQLDFARPTPVWLDGEQVAEATALSIRVEPDALVCVV
jgi:hypothetical protein